METTDVDQKRAPENDRGSLLIWEAELSNGEIVREDPKEVASWRWLRDKCRSEGLQIKELRYNGEVVHSKADSYFCFFEQIAFATTGINILTRAVGCFYLQGEKFRIHWYNLKTGQQVNTEVNYVKDWASSEIAHEMKIDRWIPDFPAL